MKNFLCILLSFLFSFFLLIEPAFAQEKAGYGTSTIALDSNGAPNWSQTSFNALGNVTTGDTGILNDPSLINAIGYNPSRSYSSNTPLSQILKLGDLQGTGILQKSLGQFLGGQNPANIALSAFPALNGMSLNQLTQAIPELKNLPAGSVPLVQSILSGNYSQLPQQGFALLSQLAPNVTGQVSSFLSSNPWAKDLPVGQLIQGDWQGAINQGLQAGLGKLVGQNPALANIPIGGVLRGCLKSQEGSQEDNLSMNNLRQNLESNDKSIR